MTAPGSESMTVTLPEGTRTESVITAEENAAPVTVAVVVAAGVRTALVTGTETESGTAADLAHGLTLEVEAEVKYHFTVVMWFILILEFLCVKLT